MKILVIVNESPWGSSLGVTALRLVRAMVAGGEQVVAIYFREEGVYHAVPGRAVDSGTPDLSDAWLSMARQSGIPVLLCSAAARRRLEKVSAEGFREAGLAEMMEMMASADRVVTF